MSYLLTIEHFDRNGESEGTKTLLFTNMLAGITFASNLAIEYFGCPELPSDGEFRNDTVHGDLFIDKEGLCINWTVLATKEEYVITVSLVAQYSEGLRLDFWNV